MANKNFSVIVNAALAEVIDEGIISNFADEHDGTASVALAYLCEHADTSEEQARIVLPGMLLEATYFENDNDICCTAVTVHTIPGLQIAGELPLNAANSDNCIECFTADSSTAIAFLYALAKRLTFDPAAVSEAVAA